MAENKLIENSVEDPSFPDRVITKSALPEQIKKGHVLVFSHQDLSKRQADVFALMMASMHKTDWDKGSPVYQFTTEQISRYLGIDSRSVRAIIKPVCNELTKKNIGIENGNNFDYTPIFSRIRYEGGILKMKPNPELKEAYIDYKKGYALINTKNYFGLNGEYSKRLYEILSRFKTYGAIRPIPLKDLMSMFGVLNEKGEFKSDKQSFRNTSVFINRCIKQSIEELRSNPIVGKEMVFPDSLTRKEAYGFELIKQGRTITHIEFTTRWVKSTDEPIHELNQSDALIKINKIERKRILLIKNGQKLPLEDLELLHSCYQIIGMEEKAEKVQSAIATRKEEIEAEQSEEQILSQAEQSMIELEMFAKQMGVESGDDY
ncbi:hypothetical protein LCGC14_1046500 [marine sediment metagenome]|uniref:Initiator Rep protein WH1 domain-containing protein n=1 Tax=marine sediment metagenome TaxID=412755 RepID=A0A0F9Q8B3_9ZZZZ|nr:RepB family plasmid replication initiator protein [Methylophaga sp.]